MKKRLISILITISILVIALSIPIVGAESRASNFITNYYASLSSGDSSGELELTYSVIASTSEITRLGVATIFVYYTDGSLARVILGNTTNGLIRTSGSYLSGTYSFTMNPGVTYYCTVKFVAENANGFDYRHYTTGTAVAPI